MECFACVRCSEIGEWQNLATVSVTIERSDDPDDPDSMGGEEVDALDHHETLCHRCAHDPTSVLFLLERAMKMEREAKRCPSCLDVLTDALCRRCKA